MATSEQQSLQHFSHQHPLQCRSLSNVGKDAALCYGCNLRIPQGKSSEYYYNCKTCSFSLHQACASAPKKTKHSAHPDHELTLRASPPQSPQTHRCKACGVRVGGFYYCCTECGIYFHILCLALPPRVMISSHNHQLELKFSPPYDFCCDLCNKPCYAGWLYRCHMCEFDAHVACAISSNPTQSIGQGQGLSTPAMAEWDEGIGSPKQDPNMTRNAEVRQSGSNNHKKPSSQISSTRTSPGPRSFQEPQTPLMSEDLITIASYQFSDFCFSIDLMRSSNSYYESNNNMNSVQATKVVPFKEVSDGYVAKESGKNHKYLRENTLYRDPRNVLHEEVLGGGVGQNEMKNNAQRQNSKSDDGNPRFSCWRIITCGIYPR